VNELSRGDRRPLHWAAQRGQVESCERLLSLGAEKDAVASDGTTPLLVAASHGRVGVVTLLLEAGD
jgi:ankyrin repeat protein